MTWILAVQGAPAVSGLGVRLRPAAQLPIARTRAVETALPRTSALDADLGSAAPELRQLLLAWWELHGRHAIPWKLCLDGKPPADGEPLDSYGVVVAEVMRAVRQHSRSMAGGRWPGIRSGTSLVRGAQSSLKAASG